jgi:hypothetical protein
MATVCPVCPPCKSITGAQSGSTLSSPDIVPVATCETEQTSAKDALRSWFKKPECAPYMTAVRKPALSNEFTAFKTQIQRAYDAAIAQYTSQIATGDRLSVAAERLGTIQRSLEEEKARLLAEKTDEAQKARSYRRSFQDGDPQSGVGGSPGVRTRDDRILLAFWINMAAALVALVVAVCWRQGVSNAGTAGTAATVLLIAYIISYYMITKFA